ncbi:MAG: hypothetical protein AAGI44_01080 [Pseudomonadota bacterium]
MSTKCEIDKKRIGEAMSDCSELDCALISNRSALRILPLSAMKSTSTLNKLSPKYFALKLFGALLVSKVLLTNKHKSENLKQTAIEIEESLSDLYSSLDESFELAASTDQIHYAASLNMAGIVTGACLESLRWAIRVNWYFKLDTNLADYYSITGAEEYSTMAALDIKRIVEMRMSPTELYATSLWDTEPSSYLKDRWNSLRDDYLLNSDVNWKTLTDWYEGTLSGAAIDQEIEFEIVRILGNFGVSNVSKVNEEISAHCEQRKMYEELKRNSRKLKMFWYQFRFFKASFKSVCMNFFSATVYHIKQMGSGNIIAGVAVIVTIVTAFFTLF